MSERAVLHLSIPVHDLAACRAFYVDVLGCRPGRERSDWVDVWFFGMQLTLQHRPDEVRAVDEQGVRHFGVALGEREAFDHLVARLSACDGLHWVTRPTWHAAGELSGKAEVKFADPSGNVIEIKYYPDPTDYLAATP